MRDTAETPGIWITSTILVNKRIWRTKTRKLYTVHHIQNFREIFNFVFLKIFPEFHSPDPGKVLALLWYQALSLTECCLLYSLYLPHQVGSFCWANLVAKNINIWWTWYLIFFLYLYLPTKAVAALSSHSWASSSWQQQHESHPQEHAGVQAGGSELFQVI